MSDKQILISEVISQIVADLDSGEFVALENMLESLPLENLKAYLPEGKAV